MNSEIVEPPETVMTDLEEQKIVIARHFFWLLIAGACLMIMAVVGVATTTVFVLQQKKAIADTESFVTCQREANATVIVSLKERAQAADQDRAALKLLTTSGALAIGVVLDQTKTQDQKLAAITQWQIDRTTAKGQLEDAEQKRKEHPLVEPQPC